MYLSTLLPLAMALSASASASSLHDEEHPGNSFSLGPAKNNAQITKVTYSLVPPPVPCGAGEKNTSTPPSLALWLGLSDSASNQKTDLFQPLLNWSPDQQSQNCGATKDEWCVATSTHRSSGQVQQPYVPVPQHSEVEFSVTVDDAANKIIQQVSINGKEVSRQADDKTITPTYIYSGNECDQNACGTLSKYSWSNVTISLSEADNSFQDTVSTHGARDTGMTTPDYGKTWHINTLIINRDYFYQDGQDHECTTGSD